MMMRGKVKEMKAVERSMQCDDEMKAVERSRKGQCKVKKRPRNGRRKVKDKAVIGQQCKIVKRSMQGQMYGGETVKERPRKGHCKAVAKGQGKVKDTEGSENRARIRRGPRCRPGLAGRRRCA